MHAQCIGPGRKFSGWEGEINDTSQRVGGNKTHSKLNAFGLIFPWQFILDDHDKDILTIANGKTPDTSSIFNISPKTTSKH